MANILISSAGRRVGLLKCFRESIATHHPTMKVLTIDAANNAPAPMFADQALKVPRCLDNGYLETVLSLCEAHDVRLLIPTIDTELPIYSAALKTFAERGVTICTSGPATIQICCNKLATHEWLIQNGFPTVRQTNVDNALRDQVGWPLPLIVKPYNGSASIGVRRIQTRRELEILSFQNDGLVVQEIAEGREFTVNVYVNNAGECVCAVPHWRIEVRGGEVSKGLTVKHAALMSIGRAIAENLPGARGPLNIQCFMDSCGTIRVIEINARFGGGYPLAHHAGARFTDWLLDELQGRTVSYSDHWIDNLAMLRYDEAVFVQGSRIGA